MRKYPKTGYTNHYKRLYEFAQPYEIHQNPKMNYDKYHVKGLNWWGNVKIIKEKVLE